MEDVVLKELNWKEKIVVKLFTKKEKNNIINNNYNPLKVNYKLIYEREGLNMRETEDAILNEIMEGNFIKKIIFKIYKKDFITAYKKGVKKGFNWSNNNVR